jgi:hypothetical protein
MQYTVQNNIHIAAVPVQDFKIVLVDNKKKSSPKNSCNAGFFANFKENGSLFTLPVGHLVCDYNANSTYTKKYCSERGKFNGNKFTFDSGSFAYNNQFYGKSQSTLCIRNNSASIFESTHAPDNCSYAIAGVPIMRSGEDVKFATFVTKQGWDASTLYATWHIFVGIKEVNAKTVYIMAMKTTKSNMITAAEAFKKFKALGFRDVIKLDGGGSFYFNADGTTKCTLENRRINTIITFGGAEKNPYPVPTVALTYMNRYSKDLNKWLQWELNAHGFECDIDGSFGPTTLKQLKAFQEANGLEPDGSCGPATRKALLK